MNDAELMRSAEVIQSLIDASRARIINGERVDLGLVEAKVAALHKSVSDGMDGGQMPASAAVLEGMETIAAGLDGLAVEIAANHRAASGPRYPAGNTNSGG
jgi:hypothetical protein